MKALIIFVALAISNFMYQLFSAEPNMAAAFERTWFEGTALFCYYIMDKFVWRD